MDFFKNTDMSIFMKSIKNKIWNVSHLFIYLFFVCKIYTFQELVHDMMAADLELMKNNPVA